MHDIADAVDHLPPGTTVARLVSVTGFGSRRPGEAAALAGGAVVAGSLLAGTVDAALAHAPPTGELEVGVSDPDAERAGLACGGRARVVLHPVEAIHPDAWAALRARRPVVVGTSIRDGRTRTVIDGVGPRGTTGVDDDAVDELAATLLRSGRPTREVVGDTLVESYLPPTTLWIVGRAAIGDALGAQAALLGWDVSVAETAEDAVAAAAGLASHDALVVLSHDATVDTPALAAALEHGRGFVGALGSRETQQARRVRLARQGYGDDRLARIHGPVGLDLGARSPAETAVAIVAEILAHRSGRSGQALSSASGPING